MSYQKKGGLPLGEQCAHMRAMFPQFKTALEKGSMIVEGKLRPTARSREYSFKLNYALGRHPDIAITDPPLVRNFKGDKIPHVYERLRLCLFQPRYYEFTSSVYLSDTVIGWISLWLYFYEVWHVCGEWLGGGEHPKKEMSRPSAKKRGKKRAETT
ncbi:MAG: hypothetical protein GC192_21405 [Bacteroidetes bacterium]|nr:hypothetical protein [Bacteroidota bacterium]